MDKVRDNINVFIDRMIARYSFKDVDVLEVGVGNLDTNILKFGPLVRKFVATDVYGSEFATEILDITDYESCKPHFNEFDLLIVSEVLEHVFDHRTALIHCHKMLRRGGMLLITVPWEYPEHGEDYWRYSEKTIDLLLTLSGFEVLERMQGWDGEKKTNIFRLANKS